MDINLAILSGRLAVPPLVEADESGASVAHLLVVTRPEHRRRVDVVPVVMADPPRALLDKQIRSGSRLHIVGSFVRRCPADPMVGYGRLEVEAAAISVRDDDPSYCR